jgi:hypothetical protein
MENAFGFDFSRVRIHDDARASESAAALHARAYAAGSHIVLRRDVQPGSREGRSILAHELAHVVGAPRSEPSGILRVGEHDDPEESRADAAAERVARGQRAGLDGRLAGAENVIRRQLDPANPQAPIQADAGAVPLQGGAWSDDSVSINLTPTPSGADRDRARQDEREPVWCQFGGHDRGDECKPLQACSTTSTSTFMVDAVYRVDGPPPAPEYPRQHQSQPITVGGDFFFEPNSGGDRQVSSLNRSVRYAGRGKAIHVHRFQFTAREDGMLSVSLLVGTPAHVVVYNGGVECKRVNCV